MSNDYWTKRYKRRQKPWSVRRQQIEDRAFIACLWFFGILAAVLGSMLR